MSKKDILEGLRVATIELEDKKMMQLVKQGLKEGVAPVDMINDGIGKGLTELGEGFAKGEKFMSDLMVAGEVLNEIMDVLGPEMEKGRKVGTKQDTMIIGSIEGDLHTIGKRIVIAIFIGAGYKVIDIGVDQKGQAFVDAAKKHGAVIIGSSAILSGTKPACRQVHDALVKAGMRDKVIFVVGGWDFTQEWADKVGADGYGETSVDGLAKVKALQAGELKKWTERQKKK